MGPRSPAAPPACPSRAPSPLPPPPRVPAPPACRPRGHPRSPLRRPPSRAAQSPSVRGSSRFLATKPSSGTEFVMRRGVYRENPRSRKSAKRAQPDFEPIPCQNAVWWPFRARNPARGSSGQRGSRLRGAPGSAPSHDDRCHQARRRKDVRSGQAPSGGGCKGARDCIAFSKDLPYPVALRNVTLSPSLCHKMWHHPSLPLCTPLSLVRSLPRPVRPARSHLWRAALARLPSATLRPIPPCA